MIYVYPSTPQFPVLPDTQNEYKINIKNNKQNYVQKKWHAGH